MASRSLDDLLPPARDRAKRFEAECKAAGEDVLIYCTYRPDAEQTALYAQGRTVPGKIVTNARAGESLHNYRLAFDFVPLVAGKPAWNDEARYRKCGAIAERCGLEWAGRWTGKLKETAHCQYTGGFSLKAIQAGAVVV